jgi:hypothetical protein
MALKLASFSRLKTKMTASTQAVNCKREKQACSYSEVTSGITIRLSPYGLLGPSAVGSTRTKTNFPFPLSDTEVKNIITLPVESKSHFTCSDQRFKFIIVFTIQIVKAQLAEHNTR